MHTSAINVPRVVRLAAAAAIGFGLAQTVAADTRFVNASAQGGNSGLTWADAFVDLNDALSSAQPGDEIWVAIGVYRPAAAGGARTSSFVLKSGIGLYGGFLGGEEVRAGRDPFANPTVLSGDLNADDGPDFSNSADNAYRIVTAIGLGSGVVFDGFVLEGGRADGSSGASLADSRDSASAIAIDGSSLTMVNCTIRRNWAAASGSVADLGPGSMLLGCVFVENHAEIGGGGVLVGQGTASQFDGCEFRLNTTPWDGAGVLSLSEVGIRFDDCMFVGNIAQRGGGVFFSPGAVGTIAACEFRDNHGNEGGGIAAFGSSPSIESCLFTGNTASLSGGGTFAEAGSPAILHCTFISNHAAEGITEGLGGQGGSGGGGSWYRGGAGLVEDTCYASNTASFGGGLYVIEDNTALARHCMFLNNRANEGGGLYNLISAPTIRDCLFTDNHAHGSSFAVAGGISNYFGFPIVEDCLFERNRAELGGGGIYNEGESPVIRRCIFRQNDAYDLETGWGGGILNGFNTAAIVESCEFVSNTAQLGGAIADHFGSTSSMINCTLVANRAIQQGGGVYAFINAAASYRNCVITGNLPQQITGEQPVAVEWSLVQGGHGGVGVFDAAPRFVRLPSPGIDLAWGTQDDDLGDLNPDMNSVLIDAGDPDAPLDPAGLDVALTARWTDDAGAPDVGPASLTGHLPVDLGAREFHAASCLGDFNRDGVIAVPDIFTFLGEWFAGSTEADTNRSRSLDVSDIFAYLAAFFAGCP